MPKKVSIIVNACTQCPHLRCLQSSVDSKKIWYSVELHCTLQSKQIAGYVKRVKSPLGDEDLENPIIQPQEEYDRISTQIDQNCPLPDYSPKEDIDLNESQIIRISSNPTEVSLELPKKDTSQLRCPKCNSIKILTVSGKKICGNCDSPID